MQTIFKEIKLLECFHLHVLTINIMRRSDIGPGLCVYWIDNSTASANRHPKIMLVVRSELNSAVCGLKWNQGLSEPAEPLNGCHLSLSHCFILSLSLSSALLLLLFSSLPPLCFKSDSNISLQILIGNFLVLPVQLFTINYCYKGDLKNPPWLDPSQDLKS